MVKRRWDNGPVLQVVPSALDIDGAGRVRAQPPGVERGCRVQLVDVAVGRGKQVDADRRPPDVVRIGLGRSAAEAENLARRALSQARPIGEVAAVLSLRNDTDIVLESTAPPPATSGGSGRPLTLHRLTL